MSDHFSFAYTDTAQRSTNTQNYLTGIVTMIYGSFTCIVSVWWFILPGTSSGRCIVDVHTAIMDYVFWCFVF